MITNEERIERIKKAIEVLDTWNPKDNTVRLNGKRTFFAMEYFVESTNHEDIVENINARRGSNVIPDFCKTASCALGTFGLIPWFQERGLVSDPPNGSVYYTEDVEHYGSFSAGARFFGISDEMSEYVFADTYHVQMHDVTAPMVQERLEELLHQYGG